MRFALNPFTGFLDIGQLSSSGGGGGGQTKLTGNSGGTVSPEPTTLNLNLLGDNTTGINIVGNSGTYTLTVSGISSSTTQIGTTRYATNLEASAQSLGTASLTPANISSLYSNSPLPSSQGGTGLNSPSQHQLLVTNGASPLTPLGVATNGQIPIGSTGNNPVLATLTAGSGIAVRNGPGSIQVSAIGGGIGWTNVTATTQVIVANNAYLANHASMVVFSLPASATIGDVFRIGGVQGAWTLIQAAGQQIKFGSKATTVGTSGSLASTNAGDSIECVATNTSASTIWRVVSSIGNITVV